MYRTAVTIRKIIPDRTNWTPTRSEGVGFVLKDAYYTVTCQQEKKLDTVCLFTIYLLPYIVFSSRVI